MKLAAALTIAVLATTQTDTAPPFWQTLTRGPHQVGFTVVYRHDYSRIWRTTAQDLGVERARPIRISIWYPATAGGRAMAYRDYNLLPAPPAAFSEIDQLFAKRNEQTLSVVVPDANSRKSLMDAAVAARFDAPRAAGRFPLIVYGSGLNETWQHPNFVLSEYLASHGFVVAALPQLSTIAARSTLATNPIDLETQVRDLEFALGELRREANVDPEHIIAMGHSIGGLVAAVVQLRNPLVDGVIGLDAAYGTPAFARLLSESLYYDAKNVRTTVVDLRRPNKPLDLSSIEKFRYADRYFVEVPGIFHGDFTSFPMIAVRFPTTIEGRTPEAAARGYQAVCRLVLAAARLITKGQEMERAVLSGSDVAGIPPWTLTVRYLPRTPAPPTEDEFVEMLNRRDLKGALRTLEEAKRREPSEPILDPRIMTRIGYGEVENGNLALALDIFQLLAAAHPTSADVFDSLGDVYERDGSLAESRAAFEKVLQLAPGDQTLSDSERKSLQERAAAKVKQFAPK